MTGDVVEPRKRSTPIKRKGVAVQTLAIGEKSSISLANHRAYCSKWGYHFEVLNKSLDDRHPMWQKIPVTLNLFDQGYDHVFWIDADAFFTNCNLSLKPLVDRMEQDNSTWLFSGDTLIINSAQMVWKNTQVARDILIGADKLWFPEFSHPLRENAAFAAYLAGARRPIDAEILAAYKVSDECFVHRSKHCEYLVSGSREALHMVSEDLKQQITLVPKCAINSYRNDFRRGDFIYHCAGQGDKRGCMKGFETKYNCSLEHCPNL